jgi:hypothetical protein
MPARGLEVVANPLAEGHVPSPHVSDDGSYLGSALGYRQNTSGMIRARPSSVARIPVSTYVFKKPHRI